MNNIAFIGTSHTYGECDDSALPEPWPMLLSNSLSCNHINYGIKGAENSTLCSLLIELIQEEKLDRIDSVILEPRLQRNSLVLNTKANLDPKRNYVNSVIHGTRQYMVDNPTEPVDSVLCDYLKWNISPGHMDGIPVRILESYDINSPLEKKALAEYVEHCFYFSGNVVGAIYDSIEYIKTMQTICKLAGKDFYWVLWEDISEHPIDYFKDTTSVFDSCLNPDISVEQYMESLAGKDKHCGCHHYNAKSQHEITKFLLEKLNDKRTDN